MLTRGKTKKKKNFQSDPKRRSSLLKGKGKDAKSDEKDSTRGATMKGKSDEENQNLLIQKSLENLMLNSQHFDVSDLERAKFLYIGKQTKSGLPVFYIIMHRIQQEFLTKTDLILVHIHKTFGKLLETPFVIMLDLTWCNMTDEFNASLYRAVVGLSRILRKS